MGREIRVPQSHSRKSPVREAVESDTTYRIVVGEKGNEQGHIEYLDDGTTEDQAKKELRKALRAYVGDGWGRVEYDVDGTGWRKLGESKRRVVESGAADLIGSGTLPNKYYVSHHGDFQVLRTGTSGTPVPHGNELDWASEDEDLSSRVTFGNGGEDGVFDTFDAALEKAESVAEGISEDADDLRSVIIEDHISGVIYEIILVAYPTKFGYKFEVETRDDTRFTREKLGSKFESKRRVVEEVSASQIPVDEVVSELKDIRDDLAATPSEDGVESEDDFMDVRLQVLDNGSWLIHTGDASYDTDHHGSWGADEIDATMTDEELQNIAQGLIDQAADMQAQVESRLRKGRQGLQESRKVDGKQSLTERASFTPGPWHLRSNGKHDGDRTVTSATQDICNMNGGANDNSTVYANARLIAAAPELLEALIDAEFLMRKVSINWKEAASMLDSLKRSAEDARAAIAKANGLTESRQQVVEEVEDLGTYIIYTSHLSNDPNDDVGAAAARLADHLRQKFPGLEVQIKSGVEGVGSGYMGDDPDLEFDIEYEVEHFDVWKESRKVSEGVKRFNQQFNVGSAKYVVNFHDGVSTNKDGSDFMDTRLFKNKRERDGFIDKLRADGYIEESRVVHPRRRVVRESTPRSYSATQPQSSVSESTQESSFLYVYDGTGGPVTAVLKAGDMEEAAQIAKAVAGEWYDEQENAMNLEVGATVAAGEIESFGYDSDLGFTLSPNERLYPKAVATEARGSGQMPLVERKRKVDISGLQKRGKPVETFQFKSFTVDKAKAEKEGR